ncbi:MAG: hypothetical protein HON99_00485 [Crocinitomicaceae bacterium]|nr:hypothetical protein [Crocinitomicaceae bacterium]
MRSILSISSVSIITIILIVTVVSSNLNWEKEDWKGIIESDGKGYYAYLPAIFIYQDLNFEFFESIEEDKYYDENLYYDYRSHANGQVIDKYYCGTALLESPFFLIAHLFSYLLDYELDGYSILYPISINISAIFYLLIGLIFLNATLDTYQIKSWQKAITLFAAVFGTNLFYYTVGEPGMSHVFSFALISLFYYYSRKYFLLNKKNHLLKLFFLLGLIVLTRPINGLIVFIIPFASGNYITLKQGIIFGFRNKLCLLLGISIFLCIVSIQLIIYKLSTGSFFIYAYVDEGFNFLSPHITAILFSYKKGLFLYTPIFLVAFVGCYFFWKTSRFEFFSWIGFFFLITFVLSSWWMWYYGGSFSSRVYVEYIPIFMIPLAISLNQIKRRPFKQVFLSLIVILIIACQIQTYQYRYYQIHWSEMNKEIYWANFMRIDRLIK